MCIITVYLLTNQVNNCAKSQHITPLQVQKHIFTVIEQIQLLKCANPCYC